MYKSQSSSGSYTYPSYTYEETSICPGCGGMKVQKRNDGINILCPVCNGSGYIINYPYQPYTTWYYDESQTAFN